MAREKISGRFDYGRSGAVSFKGKVSKTEQHYAKDADINVIVARAKKTGHLVDPSKPRTRTPFYGNFAVVPNFHELQGTIAEVHSEFMSLPAVLRARFKNSPELLMEFLADEKNIEEAVKLGLREKSALPKKPEVLDVDIKAGSGPVSGVATAGSVGGTATRAGAPAPAA